MWGYVDIQNQSYSEIKENMCMNIVKVCQTFAFGVSSPPLTPHCIQLLQNQLPQGDLRIAKTTSAHQSNSNVNHI